MPTVFHNNLSYPDENKHIRGVVLGHDTKQVREVYTATRSGTPDEITTRQLIEKEDLVLVGITQDDSYKTVLFKVADVSKYPIQLESLDVNGSGVDVSALLSLFKSTPLVEWLQDTSISGLLPEGIGWDGVSTKYEREKLEYVNYFLDGVDEDFLEEISQAIMFSPASKIPTQWDEAKTVLPGTGIFFEGLDNCESRFFVEWNENYEFLTFGKLKPSDKRTEHRPTTSDATRILLGSVVSNNYGLILQWTLYHLSR